MLKKRKKKKKKEEERRNDIKKKTRCIIRDNIYIYNFNTSLWI